MPRKPPLEPQASIEGVGDVPYGYGREFGRKWEECRETWPNMLTHNERDTLILYVSDWLELKKLIKKANGKYFDSEGRELPISRKIDRVRDRLLKTQRSLGATPTTRPAGVASVTRVEGDGDGILND